FDGSTGGGGINGFFHTLCTLPDTLLSMSPTMPPSSSEEKKPVPTGKSPSITLRFMAAPTDLTIAGAQGIGGGRVLEWIDKAAYAC
ncbi:hypothetical protein QP146_24795, partial [Escherichia coli]|nr:hypothetical protein [Escherichia coli]